MNSEYLQIILNTEQMLLGAIMIMSTDGTKECIDYVRTVVKPSDFADKDNERIYNAMLLCDKPPHKSNVWQSLINNNLLQSGDVMRLSMAIVNCEMSLDFDDYADAVKNYSLKRNSNKPLKIRGAL